MKLVKYMCVAKAHADGRSDAALTIHDGVWAFCPMGADHKGHDWRPSDGLPLTDAMRFTPRQLAADPVAGAPGPSAKQVAPASGRSRARPS